MLAYSMSTAEHHYTPNTTRIFYIAGKINDKSRTCRWTNKVHSFKARVAFKDYVLFLFFPYTPCETGQSSADHNTHWAQLVCMCIQQSTVAGRNTIGSRQQVAVK